MEDFRGTVTTLCYLERDGAWLMLHRVKKENDMNRDKWIGVGGHAKLYESPEECLVREVREETGLTLTSYRFRGLITFALKDVETEDMCLYTADDWEGELDYNCPEGELTWVPKSEVPDLELWPGDRVFFRLLDEERPFFSLKLSYENDELMDCAIDGREFDWKTFLRERGDV